MASVRVEGFPSPDAKTMMEATVKGESEEILTDCIEDRRQGREVALGTTQLIMEDIKMVV